jgi:protein involved in polysaccharide export with SLBB domain
MTKKIIAMLALSFVLSACESSPTENNSNANAAKPNTNTQATPAPVATASPESSPALKTEFKPGDKVKVTVNGSTAEATIVSVDEKVGKATVRVKGEKQDKTVAFADIVKQ